jgi:hypothetical protein
MMKICKYNRKFGSKDGIVLAATLIVVLIVSIVATGFIGFAMTSTRSFKRWRETDYAFIVAQTALEMTKHEVFEEFSEYYGAIPNARTRLKFKWFGENSDTTVTSLGKTGYMYTAMTNRTITYTKRNGRTLCSGTASVVFDGVNQDTSPIRGPCDIKITATAVVGGSTFSVSEVVRYELNRSHVFDYGYFVNNFGWLYGNTITTTGDIRANGNFAFKYGPNVYGDTYAAVNPDLGANGEITGVPDEFSLASYLTHNDGGWLSARPGSPTAIPAEGEDVEYWDMGYNGDPQLFEELEPLEMPYLGNWNGYKTLAIEEGGSLVYPVTELSGTGGYTLSETITTNVAAVYDGVGPDGVAETADDGCLVLVGTYDNPIVINGPVVVEKDLIIKGYFTGQGTIYVGRNTHIAGDLIAKNPPVWNKPDTTPEATAEANRDKDLLALAAKGNTVMGDYTDTTWLRNITPYIRPNGPFCTPYETDETDAMNGYDSDDDPSNGFEFNGDYRREDGGKYLYRESDGWEADRKYYQSSINPSRFQAYVQSSLLSHVDAVLYNNHVLTGYIGSTEFNGAIISRNEAINFTGSIMINWDIRLGSTSEDAIDMDLYLPVSLSAPRTRYWYQQ